MQKKDINVLSELLMTCEGTSCNLEVEDRDIQEEKMTEAVGHIDCTAEREVGNDDGWTLVTSKRRH